MPLISDLASSLSSYPLVLDALPLYTNGSGASSTIDADTWNGIESAIYNTQRHTQKTVLFFDSADRKRVCVSGTVFVSSSGSNTQLVVLGTFTSGQLAFLNNDIRSAGSMFLVDVVALDTTDDCTADILLAATTISVYIKRVDPTQTLSIGHYLVMVTILGY